MSLSQIRTDLALRAAAITGLTAYTTATDQVEVPAFVVGLPEQVVYNHEFGKNKALYVFPCRVYVGRVDMEEAVTAIDPYLYNTGAQSIKAALDNPAGHLVSNTAGAQWTNVVEARDVGVYLFGGVEYIGAEFLIQVLV